MCELTSGPRPREAAGGAAAAGPSQARLGAEASGGPACDGERRLVGWGSQVKRSGVLE